MATRCPLCGDECKTAEHVRQHLHVNHRKSALIEAYIEEFDGREERRPVAVE